MLTIDTADVPVSIHIRTERTAAESRVRLRMLDGGDGKWLVVSTDTTGSRVLFSGGSVSSPPWVRVGELTVALPPETRRTPTMTVQQRTGMVSVDANQLAVKTTDSTVQLSGSARRIEVTAGTVTSSPTTRPR